MKIGVIGATGFIGSAIADELMNNHSIKCISRINYSKVKFSGYKFDVLINANGNSNKYRANNDPVWDFKESILSVYNSIFDFNYRKYILISSIDAGGNRSDGNRIDSVYGFNKYLAEKVVDHNCKDYSIIRCPAIIGRRAIKGVVRDIMEGSKVYLTSDSTLMLINIGTVIGQLSRLLDAGELKPYELFYPSTNITIKEIGEIINKTIVYNDKLRNEYYNTLRNYRKYKSSEEYLKLIL